MYLDLHLDTSIDESRFLNLFHFLIHSGIAPSGASLLVTGPMADQTVPEHPLFPVKDMDGTPNLEVAFFNEKRTHNAALVKNHHVPKLLVGTRGLPTEIKQALVPFAHKRFLSRWLRPVLEQARNYGWPVDMLYCDHSLVGKEIVKLAQWFRMQSIEEAVNEWLTQDVERILASVIADFPQVEVHAGVGHLRKVLEAKSKDEEPLFILGSLKSGYHVPGHHHGMNYGALLTRCGGSGYFLAE